VFAEQSSQDHSGENEVQALLETQRQKLTTLDEKLSRVDDTFIALKTEMKDILSKAFKK